MSRSTDRMDDTQPRALPPALGVLTSAGTASCAASPSGDSSEQDIEQQQGGSSSQGSVCLSQVQRRFVHLPRGFVDCDVRQDEDASGYVCVACQYEIMLQPPNEMM
jgi:hypothetical protein